MTGSQSEDIMLIIGNLFSNRAPDFKKLLCCWGKPRITKHVHPSFRWDRSLVCGSEASAVFLALCASGSVHGAEWPVSWWRLCSRAGKECLAEPRGERSFYPAHLHPTEIPAGTEDSVCPASDVSGCRGGGKVHSWVPGTCSSSPSHPHHACTSQFRCVCSTRLNDSFMWSLSLLLQSWQQNALGGLKAPSGL